MFPKSIYSFHLHHHCLLSRFSGVDSLLPSGLSPASLLCPWDSPGKDTGVGSHFLLQGVFLTQGWNLCLLCLLHLQGFLTTSATGNPLEHCWSEVQIVQSCPTLCDPMDYTVHGILQARILEWIAFPFSRGSSWPRDQTQVSRIAGGFCTSWATRAAS